MEYIQDNNRNQIGMLSLDQIVEPEFMVRIINTFVKMLNLKEYDFNFFSLNKQGNPSYHWVTMMKLHIYGLKKTSVAVEILKKLVKTISKSYGWLMSRDSILKSLPTFEKTMP
jgi:hypothetical protein